MKTAELTGAALDWAVAKCEHPDLVWGNSIGIHHASLQIVIPHLPEPQCYWNPSTSWLQAGPIIERENISIIRLHDAGIPDAKGFWQGKYVSQWGAVMGDRHSAEEQHGSQGDYWGMSYHVDEDAVCAETPLIAAMRCYVASKLGDNVDIPAELQ